VLDLLVVRIAAGVGLAATLAGFALGSRGRRLPGGQVPIIASRDPARWTVAVWMIGTFVFVLSPVAILLAPGLVVRWPAVPDFQDSDLLQLLGIVLWALAGLLFLTASRALGRHLTPAIQAQQGHELVQKGPYRYIRHPIYTANITLGCGLSLLFLSPPLALLTLAMAGIASYRARLEEELLRSPQVFGETYEDYMGRTGRFLPKLSRRT
jgi:protein-S-isoprenylcysteine O-methyltransferase Ste14